MDKQQRQNIEKEISKFGRFVVKESKAILSKNKLTDSGKLKNSIKFTEKETDGVYELAFFMEDYGRFQDQGVKGAGGVRKTTSKYDPSNNKGKLWKQKAPNSPFSYKRGGKKPPISAFKRYAQSKGISPFAISYSIWAQGLKPTMFFTKPFQKAFKRLPNDLIEEFSANVEVYLNNATINR